MSPKISDPISVSLSFNHEKRKTTISKVVWKNRVYKIKKHGLHYTFKRGNTLMHVFSVVSDTTNFKLILDTSSLNWTLEEVYDAALK